MLTSGIIFPLIKKIELKKESIIEYIKAVNKCFILFVLVLIISGQFQLLFNLKERIISLSQFSGKISFNERLYQYSHFVKGILIPNAGKIELHKYFYGYSLCKYINVSGIGVLILIICVISFIMNRKNKIALISFLWIIFSIIILFVVGWGLVENGLILYSLYFAWAFLILIYLFIKTIIKNINNFKAVIGLLSFMFFILGSIEIINIIKFTIKYY